mmetsp:Transcript_18488/g.39564  ORF Transcript_18488/g.39564 Transcript_18488/m.39564 type:complete len:204 (+) Transcript_18488:249-860(+)
MLDEPLRVRGLEALEVFFQVGLGRCTAASDRHGVVLVVVAAWACFEKVRSLIIDTSHQHADSVGSLAGLLCLLLRHVGNLQHQSTDHHGVVVDESVVQALVSHVLGQHTSVCCQPRDADAHVLVDLHDLLLVMSQLGLSLLVGGQDHVSVASKSQNGGSLLDGFHGVLHLQDAAARAPGDAVHVILLVLIHSGNEFGLFLFVL